MIAHSLPRRRSGELKIGCAEFDIDSFHDTRLGFGLHQPALAFSSRVHRRRMKIDGSEVGGLDRGEGAEGASKWYEAEELGQCYNPSEQTTKKSDALQCGVENKPTIRFFNMISTRLCS